MGADSRSSYDSGSSKLEVHSNETSDLSDPFDDTASIPIEKQPKSPRRSRRSDSPPRQNRNRSRSRGRKLKDKDKDDNGSVRGKSSERPRRKGSKKLQQAGSMTPNPKSKTYIEIEDPARLTDLNANPSTRRVSKRSNSIARKRQNSKDLSTASTLPSALPFGDDDTVASKSSKSGRKPKSKSPGRVSKRYSRVDVKAYEDEITNLRNEIIQLKEERYQTKCTNSKMAHDLKQQVSMAELELQKCELDNREVRTELRDNAAALQEAEMDILDLTRRFKEKANEVIMLEEELEDLQTQTRNGTKQRSEMDVPPGSYRSLLNAKDDKIATLQSEMKRHTASTGNKTNGAESIQELKLALTASQAEVRAVQSKYIAAQERNLTLDDDVQHWKTQALKMEDEMQEVRTQLNYWMAKYEDVVGASDSAKAELATPRANVKKNLALKDLQQLDTTFASEYGSYALDNGSAHRDQEGQEEGGIGGLWKKLTTPGRERRKVSVDF